MVEAVELNHKQVMNEQTPSEKNPLPDNAFHYSLKKSPLMEENHSYT